MVHTGTRKPYMNGQTACKGIKAEAASDDEILSEVIKRL